MRSEDVLFPTVHTAGGSSSIPLPSFFLFEHGPTTTVRICGINTLLAVHRNYIQLSLIFSDVSPTPLSVTREEMAETTVGFFLKMLPNTLFYFP